jgi:hypothetical protein
LFLSLNSASQKLKILCIEEIEQYVTHQCTLNNDNEFSQIILELSTHGIEMIWPNISSNIKHRFYEEFANLFDNDPNHIELDEMIALSKDINIDWQQFIIQNTAKPHFE